MPAKLMENIDRDESAVAFVDGIPRKGDMTLVAAAKNGNRKAFETLVKRHEQKIFFVARRITRSREDAEDVVQQTFQRDRRCFVDEFVVELCRNPNGPRPQAFGSPYSLFLPASTQIPVNADQT